jgi:hypothetical protein
MRSAPPMPSAAFAQSACAGAQPGAKFKATVERDFGSWDNYIADVKHKSTVRVINIDHSSGWVAKGATSYAHHTQGAAYTCYAYYDNA